jgi:glycosyltransferase involved in cell wall biosynthesis
MQFGVPVITNRADGTEDDYIDDGINGFICKDINEIVDKVDVM